MRKSLVIIGVFIVVTTMLIVYVKSNVDLNIVEVQLEQRLKPNQVRDMINDMYAYDYVNVYNVLLNNKLVKLCDGNTNILLEQYSFEDMKLTYMNNEVIVGEKCFEGNEYKYSMLPETLQIYDNIYNINGILLNTDDVIYRDLNLLSQCSFVSQDLYIEKSSIDEYVDIYTIKTVLENKYISVRKIYNYMDLYNILKIILFVFISIAFLIFIYCIYMKLKTILSQFSTDYNNQKKSVYISQYLSQKDNLIRLLKIILLTILIIMTIVLCGILLNDVLSTRVNLNLNIVSIKNIAKLFNQYKEFLRYNMKNGFSYYEIIILKISIIYIVLCIVAIVSILKSVFKLSYKYIMGE